MSKIHVLPENQVRRAYWIGKKRFQDSSRFQRDFTDFRGDPSTPPVDIDVLGALAEVSVSWLTGLKLRNPIDGPKFGPDVGRNMEVKACRRPRGLMVPERDRFRYPPERRLYLVHVHWDGMDHPIAQKPVEFQVLGSALAQEFVGQDSRWHPEKKPPCWIMPQDELWPFQDPLEQLEMFPKGESDGQRKQG